MVPFLFKASSLVPKNTPTPHSIPARSGLFRNFWLTLLFVLINTGGVGCGYSTKSLTPSGIHTVAIPIAKNITLYRHYELPLTRRVTQEIMARTDLSIVEESYADSILRIRIIDIRQPVITEDELDRVTEVRILITTQLEWADLRTGEILLKRTRITESNEFSALQGENIQQATERALGQMAERIVTEMESAQW
ncbi:MAG: LPS assembly lipoprotein LptE [Planctomycetota bacterium]|jgi:hypothetical protein|nr:LPS assembly lipoprotein LptE [Planctomycetota bacterium]